jgi:hypothetical protein
MREQQKMLETELSKWTGFSWNIQHGGRHTKIVLHRGEQRRACPFSLTPVPYRALLNNVTQLRRALREIGAEKVRN